MEKYANAYQRRQEKFNAKMLKRNKQTMKNGQRECEKNRKEYT